MIANSKIAVVCALVAMSIASPALAQSHAAVEANHAVAARDSAVRADRPALTGGGSSGYNFTVQTDE